MERYINKVLRIFKKKYFVIVFLFVCAVSLLGATYSYWAIESGWNLASELKFKELNYLLHINDESVNTIVSPANSGTVYYNVKITSLNDINTRYSLTYKSTASGLAVEVASSSENDSDGIIGLYEVAGENIKIIKIAVTNNTANDSIVELSVVGGYTWNPESEIDLPTGFSRISGIHEEELLGQGLTLAEELNILMGCTPTSESACLVKENTSNYLTYSNKTWRIVGTYLIDSEFVTKVILDEPLTTKVTSANISSELTSFYNTLDTSLIRTSSPFTCTGTTDIACTGSANIGLLSKAEYDKIGGVNSYLYTKPNKEYWLNDTYYMGTSRGIINGDTSSLAYIRPVIYLKNETVETTKTSNEVEVTNLVTNGSFENGSTGWTAGEGVVTISSDTASATSTAIWQITIAQTGISINPTHIYYYSVYQKSTNTAIASLMFYNSSNTLLGQQNYDECAIYSNFAKSSMRFSPLANTISASFSVQSCIAATNTITIKQPMLVDLTADFGAGNEPSKAWCDANLSYFDGTDTVEIKSGLSGTSSNPYVAQKGVYLIVNLNGGVSNIKNGYYASGETYQITKLSKTGNVFNNWTVSGTGASANSTSFTMGSTSTTFTANWLAANTLIIDANGGLWNGTTVQYLTSNAQVTIADPTKANYIFTGWIVEGTGSSINEGLFTMGTEATTLTATWADGVTNFGYLTAASATNSVYHTYEVPATGYYLIELWGAKGTSSKTSYGGYTSGIIHLNEAEELYLYIGQQGTNVTNGFAYNAGYGSAGAAPGGGATDVRLVEGAWNNPESLNSRIMVAAGSGSEGANAGGLIGASGGATGGTQTSGGIHAGNFTDGQFGIGGNGRGGGGGYYGGGGSADAVSRVSGGGSSYISGFAGSNSVYQYKQGVTPQEINNTNPREHTNNTIHYSEKYFIEGEMKTGIDSESTGNGRARITYIGNAKPERKNLKLNDVRYIKDCSTGSRTGTTVDGYVYWSEFQAIVEGENIAYDKTIYATEEASSTFDYDRVTDGNLGTSASYYAKTNSSIDGVERCIIIDLGINPESNDGLWDLDELAVWHLTAPTYPTYVAQDNVTYVSSSNTSSWNSNTDASFNWRKVIDTGNIVETSEGKRVSVYDYPIETFRYIEPTQDNPSPYQIFTADRTGAYYIEAFGGQGVGTVANGAKTSGIIQMQEDEDYYIYIGGEGSGSAGGYNGGGTGGVGSAAYGGGGGGATDIRYFGNTAPTSTDLLWDSGLGLNSRIMVAAGGGGGYGGGAHGSAGGALTASAARYGTGGSQISGGTFRSGSSSGTTSGGFGYGGNGGIGGNYSGGGGGGAGYYGGSGGSGHYNTNSYYSGGSGGSSYISGYIGVNSVIEGVFNPPSHSGNTNHYSGKIFTSGEMTAAQNVGNGKLTITYID